MTQITTLSFCKYTSLRNKFWGLKMMQFAHKGLANTNGLTFYRLLGSGRGKGFNPFPDWSVYCLLQVWESEASEYEAFTRTRSGHKKSINKRTTGGGHETNATVQVKKMQSSWHESYT